MLFLHTIQLSHKRQGKFQGCAGASARDEIVIHNHSGLGLAAQGQVNVCNLLWLALHHICRRHASTVQRTQDSCHVDTMIYPLRALKLQSKLMQVGIQWCQAQRTSGQQASPQMRGGK